MHVHRMFCSGCDRDVSVLRTELVGDDAQANIPDPELICLEIGDWCTGAMCPLGAAQPNAMVARLIHSGLHLDHLQTIRMHCDDCGFDSDFALYGRNLAACLVCGTTRDRPPEAVT